MELGGQEAHAEAFAHALPVAHGLQRVAADDVATSPDGQTSQSRLRLLRYVPMGHDSDELAAMDVAGGATATAEVAMRERNASGKLRSCAETDAAKLEAAPMLELTRPASVPFWLVTAKLACRLDEDRRRRATPSVTLMTETAVYGTFSVAASAVIRVAFWAPPKSLTARPPRVRMEATV